MGKQKEVILEGLSPNQREAAETLDRDVLVRAGAGSGKTKTLTAHHLLLLDENRDWLPSEITAVTFTRKAAREMQSRIRKQMADLAHLADSKGDSEEKRFWMERLSEMDSANIGTIHSLCGRILRMHPAEAGLDPAFSVLDDNSAAMLRNQIIEETVSRISENSDYEALLNLYDGNRLTGILSDMLKNREKTNAAMAVKGLKTEAYLRKQAEDLLHQPKYADIIEEYRTLSAEAGFEKKAGILAGRIRGLIAAYGKGLQMLNSGCHPADAVDCVYSPYRDWNFRMGNGQLKANAQWMRDELVSDFPFVKDDKGRDIKWFRDFWEQYDLAAESLRTLWPLMRDAYTEQMNAAQAIDFDAMESLTLELLRTHPEICETWAGQIKALLVDEYQDTNNAQNELFALLNPENDRLFAVGDKKQSIYGFRGTNVSLFDLRGKEVKKNGGKDVMLDITYRTAAELLEPMGSLLEKVMKDGELSGRDFFAGYEAMRSGNTPHDFADYVLKIQPCIEILISDIQQKEADPNKETAGRMLAQRLSELRDSGMMHSWNDAAILCRNTDDFKQFENALEAWHIPYVTVSGKGYYDRPEIRDILNILTAAENPHNNAAMTGFLLSPVIGFSLEMTALLYRYANKGGLKKSFFQAFSEEGFRFEELEKQAKLERARSILSDLIRISGQVPLDEVLEEAFHLTGIRTVLALDAGDRAWLNLDKLLPTARESGLTSVSEFLEYLEEIKETGAREGEAPSDNNGAVRIMTIHQAKGLEFPVTVICENEAGSHSPQFAVNTDGSPVFYSSPATPQYKDAQKLSNDRDKAEWLRLFYVAATRAEYRLILCGKKPKMNGAGDSWLKRVITEFPEEWLLDGENIGPAWGVDGEAVRIRCCSSLPDVQPGSASDVTEAALEDDCRLLPPISVSKPEPRKPGHTVALTIGKLVHKGMELWRFPDPDRPDPILGDAFRKILMQNDDLAPEEQQTVQKKAVLLLSRFKGSEAFRLIESSGQRWHEIPFSLSGRNFAVSGVIDLLLKDDNGYAVIDFKTDELKDMDDLRKAVETHREQLEKYRRALRTTLGEDPRCLICFLDAFGKVILEPIGGALSGPEDEIFFRDEWDPEPI